MPKTRSKKAKEKKSAQQQSSNVASNKNKKNPVQSLFDQFSDTVEKDKMNVEGVIKFLKELGLQSDSRLVLIMAWKCEAQTQCEFTRKEFYRGFQELQVSTLQGLKTKLNALDAELQNDDKMFKDFYKFTFSYALDPDRRVLLTEAAIAYWTICLQEKFSMIGDWCRFVKGTAKNCITKDEWDMLLEFALKIGDNLENYDFAGSWPILMDDFAQWISVQK